MGVRACILALVLLAVGPLPARALAAEEQPDEAQAVFQSAFGEGVGPAERVRTLERLVKEHAESRWADDALWVLGEAARQQGLPGRVVYYWQYLTGMRPGVELESFTRDLQVYQASGVPQLLLYLQATGASYVQGTGLSTRGDTVLVNARAFDPVPMRVWEGLARAYESLGEPRLALRAYGRALEAAPAVGPWAGDLQENTQRLERELNVAHVPSGVGQGTAGGPRQPAPAAGVAEPGSASGARPAGPPPQPPATGPTSQAAAP
jgi:tetratricopeptide (TPR) repeat protein